MDSSKECHCKCNSAHEEMLKILISNREKLTLLIEKIDNHEKRSTALRNESQVEIRKMIEENSRSLGSIKEWITKYHPQV